MFIQCLGFSRKFYHRIIGVLCLRGEGNQMLLWCKNQIMRPKVCYSDRFFFFQSFMHNTAFFRTPHFPKLHSQSKYFSFHHHQLLFYNKPHTWLMFVTTPQLSVTITCNIYSITRAVHFQFGRDKPQTSKIRIFRNSLVIIIIIVNAGDYFNGSPLITRLIINPQHGGSHYENVLCVDRVP